MTLLFILLGFIVGIYLFFPSSEAKKSSLCKMHKWAYNNEGTDEEYMSCSVCNRRPGQAIDDGSEL
jgi:hypothetical protein